MRTFRARPWRVRASTTQRLLGIMALIRVGRPAISYVESSKGAVCFRSHNAWGYGSYSFGSWEEGINRVVSALGGSLYGGYLTREAAATYCPSNPGHWYNSCAEQMAQI